MSGTEHSIQHSRIVTTRRREVVHHRREGDAIVARVVNVGAIELDPPGITIGIAELSRFCDKWSGRRNRARLPPGQQPIHRLDHRPRGLRTFQRQFLGDDIRRVDLRQRPLRPRPGGVRPRRGDSSASGITSLASTVQRSGVTSAKPPATNSGR